MTQTAYDISSQVTLVNKLLEEGEPTNISVDDYSHYTGYKPQFIIDSMNQAFGFGNWGFEEVSNEIAEGDKATLVISQVRVFLKDCAFQPTGWGQSRITKGDIGDAKKGAQTDAIKKALSYFSIGNRAYHGLLAAPEKDVNGTMKPVKDVHPNQNGKKSSPPPAKKTVEAAPPQQSENLHALIGQAKQRAKALGLAHDKPTWEAVLQEGTGEALQEKDLTLALVARLNGHLTKVERERQQAQAG